MTIADLRRELDRLLVEGAAPDFPVWIRICVDDVSHFTLLDDVRVNEQAAVLGGSSLEEDASSDRVVRTVADLRRELGRLLAEGASIDLPVRIRIRVDVDCYLVAPMDEAQADGHCVVLDGAPPEEDDPTGDAVVPSGPSAYWREAA